MFRSQVRQHLKSPGDFRHLKGALSTIRGDEAGEDREVDGGIHPRHPKGGTWTYLDRGYTKGAIEGARSCQVP